MEDHECVVCMDQAQDCTDCCKQPLHQKCLRKWVDGRKSTVAKTEVRCPYCRQEMKNLPVDIDESWMKDEYFVEQLKKAWGERPFWRANGSYWGTLEWNWGTESITCFLGHEKHQVFGRIKMYLSFQ
ncbi:hypothetical protein OS493_010727 [Desmophyllum pertusum]|uniref:RING-type domain-containing protein n=1 Tax=Desmophyllum pertusum TaxID=174260 RepID=A0A9W9ZSP9_9CNID|nr:hypothetical protein OS493_010727 [Desmophyllum pertusum]